MTCCKECGQEIPDIREGVKLTPLKAALFDLILKRPGITREELAGMIYSDSSESRKLTIGAHVHQIKELFLDHPTTELIGKAHYGYRIKRHGTINHRSGRRPGRTPDGARF